MFSPKIFRVCHAPITYLIPTTLDPIHVAMVVATTPSVSVVNAHRPNTPATPTSPCTPKTHERYKLINVTVLLWTTRTARGK